jgi:hypothetical protein
VRPVSHMEAISQSSNQMLSPPFRANANSALFHRSKWNDLLSTITGIIATHSWPEPSLPEPAFKIAYGRGVRIRNLNACQRARL